jgi:Flp pilus assembly protein TadG
MRASRIRPTSTPGEPRRGAALVELAVCLPTLVFVMLMAMEAADVIFLKQSLHVAAYEAARTAIKPDSTTTLAEDAAEQILNNRQVSGYLIDFTPNDVSGVTRGEIITVTVSAPVTSNTALPSWYPGTSQLQAQVKMNKE